MQQINNEIKIRILIIKKIINSYFNQLYLINKKNILINTIHKNY